MDTVPNGAAQTPDGPAAPDGQDRIAREAARIAEARAELAAGLYVDLAEMGAWIDSLGTDYERPPPPTRRR